MQQITQPDLQAIRSELVHMAGRLQEIGVSLFRQDEAGALCLNRAVKASEVLELLAADLGLLLCLEKKGEKNGL